MRENVFTNWIGGKPERKDKIITVKEAASYVKDGSVLMKEVMMKSTMLIQWLPKFNLIANDTVVPDKGTGKMIVNKQFKIIVSHIGTNRKLESR